MNMTLGANNERTLEIDNNLGVALVVANQPLEAATVLQWVVDRRRITNPGHYEFGRNLGNLGGALVFSDRCVEAEAVLREAVDLTRNSPDRLGALSARSLLGHALECQERWKEAETIYREVLAERRLLGDQQLPRTLGALARLYAKQQKWEAAVPHLAELMHIEKPGLDRSLEDLTTRMAQAMKDAFEPDRAEPLLRECSAALEKRLFKGDWLTAEMESRHGDSLRRMGRFEEAEPILTAAANDAAKALGAPSWAVSAARRRVVELYLAWKKPDEAAKWM
jgi:lipopolysaccharide biosynthesis regulator YciM